MNLDAIKKGKLALAEVYKRPKQLPQIADESVIINEYGNRKVPKQDPAPRPSTSTANLYDNTPPISTQKMRQMTITVGKRKFECVPIKNMNKETEKSKEAKLDAIFAILQAQQKKAKMGPAQTQGLT